MGGKTNNQQADHVRKTNGKIGELLSSVELLKHGFNVSWPVVDEGYDLIADDTKGALLRLQVKTALTGVRIKGCTTNLIAMPSLLHSSIQLDQRSTLSHSIK
jgi:hypothetical protein